MNILIALPSVHLVLNPVGRYSAGTEVTGWRMLDLIPFREVLALVQGSERGDMAVLVKKTIWNLKIRIILTSLHCNRPFLPISIVLHQKISNLQGVSLFTLLWRKALIISLFNFSADLNETPGNAIELVKLLNNNCLLTHQFGSCLSASVTSHNSELPNFGLRGIGQSSL